MRSSRMLAATLLLAALMAGAAQAAQAQGKSKSAPGHGTPPGHAKQAKAKKVVTVDNAIVATRDVLVRHGYEVVRVEVVNGARVVYYRRGNNGRGKGKGPLQKMVIRPGAERPRFEAAPKGILVDINIRLGL